MKAGEECEMGEECPYSHDPEIIKNYVPFTKRFPCKRLQKGQCELGDDCRYSHTLTEPVKKDGETDPTFTDDTAAYSVDFDGTQKTE